MKTDKLKRAIEVDARIGRAVNRFVNSAKTEGSIRNTKWFWVQLLVLCLPTLSGCGFIPWTESYGEVTGTVSTRSLNGVGVHRRMWETAGVKVLTPQKLSSRLDKIDSIVLIGTTYRPPGQLAREWLEKWLKEKSGRTVVYFGRDFDAIQLYRQDTLDQVAPSDRERAETQLASRQATNYTSRLQQIPEGTFCRWFYLQTSAPPTEYASFTGPWAKELQGLEGKWPVSMLLEPPNTRLKTQKPSWIKSGIAPLAPARTIFQGVDGEEQLGDKEIQRSIWKADELKDAKSWDSEWSAAGEYEVLLAGSDNSPLIHRITHSSFKGSQILIVANGAPFLNGSLIKPLHRGIGELIIKECLPAKRIAMIRFDETGLLISNIESGSERDFGMQLLTVWPLSAITMHAAFLGIIAFAVLLPILGRPQRLKERSVTDFGLHIEALGRMLFEARDLQYGLRSITDYFTKVRRESPPAWVPEMAAMEAASLAAAEEANQKRLASKAKRKSRGKPTSALATEPTQLTQPLPTTPLPQPVAPAQPTGSSAEDRAKPTNVLPSDELS